MPALENQFARNIFHDSLFLHAYLLIYAHYLHIGAGNECSIYAKRQKAFCYFTYRVIAFHVLKCTLCVLCLPYLSFTIHSFSILLYCNNIFFILHFSISISSQPASKQASLPSLPFSFFLHHVPACSELF